MHNTRDLVSRLMVGLVLAGLLIASSCFAATPNRRRSRGYNSAAARAAQQARLKQTAQQLQAQIAMAQSVLQGATAHGMQAQGKVSMAQAKLDEAAQTITRMKEEVDTAEKELREIEADLEEQQPAMSEYAQAKAEAESTNKAFLALRKQLLEAPTTRAAIEAAKGTSDPGAAMIQAQHDAFDSDPNYFSLSVARDSAQHRYSALRQQLFTTDEGWKISSKELRDYRQQIAAAEAAIAGSGIHKASAHIDLKKAQQTANAAAAVVQQSQSQLKSVQSRITGSKPAAKPASAAPSKK